MIFLAFNLVRHNPTRSRFLLHRRLLRCVPSRPIRFDRRPLWLSSPDPHLCPQIPFFASLNRNPLSPCSSATWNPAAALVCVVLMPASSCSSSSSSWANLGPPSGPGAGSWAGSGDRWLCAQWPMSAPPSPPSPPLPLGQSPSQSQPKAAASAAIAPDHRPAHPMASLHRQRPLLWSSSASSNSAEPIWLPKPRLLPTVGPSRPLVCLRAARGEPLAQALRSPFCLLGPRNEAARALPIRLLQGRNWPLPPPEPFCRLGPNSAARAGGGSGPPLEWNNESASATCAPPPRPGRPLVCRPPPLSGAKLERPAARRPPPPRHLSGSSAPPPAQLQVARADPAGAHLTLAPHPARTKRD